MGLPLISRSGLRGRRVEAIRAGMIATAFIDPVYVVRLPERCDHNKRKTVRTIVKVMSVEDRNRLTNGYGFSIINQKSTIKNFFCSSPRGLHSAAAAPLASYHDRP